MSGSGSWVLCYTHHPLWRKKEVTYGALKLTRGKRTPCERGRRSPQYIFQLFDRAKPSHPIPSRTPLLHSSHLYTDPMKQPTPLLTPERDSKYLMFSLEKCRSTYPHTHAYIPCISEVSFTWASRRGTGARTSCTAPYTTQTSYPALRNLSSGSTV